MEIPRGNGREDIKARRQIIKDYYASWCAALSFESTDAVLHLSEVLAYAIPAGILPRKYNDKNQKPYSKMMLLRWNICRLIVGLQKSTGEYVQYYLGSE